MKYILLVLFGCYAKNDVHIETKLYGTVMKIVDGDTYDILIDKNKTLRIRMEGIDAPERGMPFYRVSKDYLGKLCFGGTVLIVQTNTDRNGRVIAKTYMADGTELGLLMIEAGFAWHFKRYSTDIQLSDAEVKARNDKRGLWIDKMPVAPWIWRKRAGTKNYKSYSH